MDGRFIRIERLETRALLAHIGLDVTFGDAGRAPVAGATLVEQLPGGKILAVAASATRLNPDGTIDARLTAPDAEPPHSHAVISGQRLIFAGQRQTVDERSVVVSAVHLDSGATDASFGTGGVTTFPTEAGVKNTTVFSFAITTMIATPDGGVILGVYQSLRHHQADVGHAS